VSAQLAGSARRYRWALIGVAALVLFPAGFLIGSARAGVSLHTGVASSTEQTIGIETDGWTYGIPLDIRWEDATGTAHFGGRPDCLPPSNTEVGPITFAAIEVSIGGSTWRQVVWVSCRYGG
jgi:hypothetical protein